MKNVLIIALFLPILSFAQNFKCESQEYSRIFTVSKTKKIINISLTDHSLEKFNVFINENSMKDCAEMDSCKLEEVNKKISLVCTRKTKSVDNRLELLTNERGMLALRCHTTAINGDDKTFGFKKDFIGKENEVVCEETLK